MSADWEEEWEQWSASPVGATHKRIEGRSFLCGHENPFDGWTPIVGVIPLRIDSLVEILGTFVKVIFGKCKQFINKVEVLLPGDFTTKDTKGHEEDMGFLAAVSIDKRVSRGQGCCALPIRDSEQALESGKGTGFRIKSGMTAGIGG